MKKENYTRPVIVKVELNHEQAVLATCAAVANTPEDNTKPYCRPATFCKRDNVGDSAASS